MTMQLGYKAQMATAALGAALMLAACDTGGRSGDDAAKEAGRRNVDAMSREHAGDVGTPSGAAGGPLERAVVAETLPYAEVEDELVYGHFVFPADMVDPLPAIIVIHEWWGLNEGVRAMADRIAAEGYIVLAIDLFGGAVATSPGQARALMLSVVEDSDHANENIRQAYEFVDDTAGAPRVGVLGWCFGGGWSLNTAMLFPEELDAAVIYYGQVTSDEDKLRPIEAPILGHFAEDDRGIPAESVEQFRDALENLRKNYEIEIYPNTEHAFANPSGNNYNEAAAEQAWARTLEFLDLHLSIN